MSIIVRWPYRHFRDYKGELLYQSDENLLLSTTLPTTLEGNWFTRQFHSVGQLHTEKSSISKCLN